LRRFRAERYNFSALISDRLGLGAWPINAAFQRLVQTLIAVLFDHGQVLGKAQFALHPKAKAHQITGLQF